MEFKNASNDDRFIKVVHGLMGSHVDKRQDLNLIGIPCGALREATCLTRLRIDNVAPATAAYVKQGSVYIRMPFKGVSVATWLLNRRSIEERYMLASSLLVSISKALNELRVSGILHLDINTHNVVVDRDGVPHLIDFNNMSFEGYVSKRPSDYTHFTAPECFQGNPEPITYKADVYALAVLVSTVLLQGDIPSTMVVDESSRSSWADETDVHLRGLYPSMETDIIYIALVNMLRGSVSKRWDVGQILQLYGFPIHPISKLSLFIQEPTPVPHAPHVNYIDIQRCSDWLINVVNKVPSVRTMTICLSFHLFLYCELHNYFTTRGDHLTKLNGCIFIIEKLFSSPFPGDFLLAPSMDTRCLLDIETQIFNGTGGNIVQIVGRNREFNTLIQVPWDERSLLRLIYQHLNHLILDFI